MKNVTPGAPHIVVFPWSLFTSCLVAVCILSTKDVSGRQSNKENRSCSVSSSIPFFNIWLYFAILLLYFSTSLCRQPQNVPVTDATANSCCICSRTTCLEALLHKQRRHTTNSPRTVPPFAGVRISGFEICYQISDNRFASSPPREVEEIIGDVHAW